MLITTSKNKKKTYVGYTNNLDQRLKKHNSNKGAKSTKGYKWLLIYSKKFKNKSSISIWFSEDTKKYPVQIWLKMKYGGLMLKLEDIIN